MISIEITGVKKNFFRTMLALTVTGITMSILYNGTMLDYVGGYLARQPAPSKDWRTLEAKDIEDGAIIEPNTNTIFHLPATFERINRETLLGQKGKRTRYWGYCFPENDPPETVDRRTGFPGLLFLSEKERAVRATQAVRQEKEFNPTLRLPSSTEVDQLNNPSKPAIRHQIDTFLPNTLCYIMSEAALSIGLDADNDRLNDELEREAGTNAQAPDSDGDGISDGIEYMYGTKPLLRDTDSDGIIDGIEDANWNGHVEISETDPRTLDTDRDTLCDGMCRVRLKKRDVFIGEDKNLNGTVDDGETDPRLISTKRDGVSDDVLFLQCLADGRDNCP